MRYVHCSWDVLEKLSPRIPETRLSGPAIWEDNTIPRICVAKNVLDALHAMPRTADVILQMQKFKMPVIIHAYYLKQDLSQVIHPTRALVPDVDQTHELWMLKEPLSMSRCDFLIEDPIIFPVKDQNGKQSNYLFNCRLKQAKFQSNTENFLKSLGKEDAELAEKLHSITPFRKLILEESLEKIVEETKLRRTTV